MKKAVIFDLDGTLYFGENPVEGALEMIVVLTDQDYRVFFLTNNSGKTKQEIIDKLKGFGFASDFSIWSFSGLILSSLIIIQILIFVNKLKNIDCSTTFKTVVYKNSKIYTLVNIFPLNLAYFQFSFTLLAFNILILKVWIHTFFITIKFILGQINRHHSFFSLLF